MRTCGSCGELLGDTVQTCPFCGVSASDKEMTEIKHERIKQDMIYEDYKLDQAARKREFEKENPILGALFGGKK